jgi:hypothetical protein
MGYQSATYSLAPPARINKECVQFTTSILAREHGVESEDLTVSLCYKNAPFNDLPDGKCIRGWISQESVAIAFVLQGSSAL